MANEFSVEEISFTMADGSVMRGRASTGPDIERVELRHEMPGGSWATQVLWRAVEQVPPAPVALAEPAPQQAPADEE